MALSYVYGVLQSPIPSMAMCAGRESKDSVGARACIPTKVLSRRKEGPGLQHVTRLRTSGDGATRSRALPCRASGGGSEQNPSEGVPADALRSQREHSGGAGNSTGAGSQSAGSASKEVGTVWSRATRFLCNVWKAVAPDVFLRNAPLDDVLEHYEEKRMAPVRQGSAPEYRIFGREELLQEFTDLLKGNVMLGFNAPRKLYNIVGITGGSGAGKTALLQYVQRQFCEWSKGVEPAQDTLERLLQQGAFIIYNVDFNGGGHKFSPRDALLTAEQRVGVRLFACLLDVSLVSLRDEYGLPIEVERRLTVEAVVALGARRQRLSSGLDRGATILSVVFMDELNSGLYQVQQYVVEAQQGFVASWPAFVPAVPTSTNLPTPDSPAKALNAVFLPSSAPSYDLEQSNGPFPLNPDQNAPPMFSPIEPAVASEVPSMIESYSENVLKEMVEATAAVFTAEETAAQSKAGSSGVVGVLGIAATGMPMLNLYPSSWAITFLTVTNLKLLMGAQIVQDRVECGDAGSDESIMRAFLEVFRSREFRGLIQIYGGTPNFMVWLAQTFMEEDVRKQLRRLLTGQVSVAMLCTLIEAKVHERLSSWGKYPITDDRGMAKLGGWQGILELVTLTLTGVPVGPRYLVGGRVTLSRTESTGVVFTKPFVREAPREVAQLEKQTKNKAAADAEVKTRLSKLPILANPLRQSTFSPTFSPRASSLKVLDIPPVIQEKMLAAVYAEQPELVERLSPLMATTKAVLNSAFVGPRFEESVQRLLIARFDMFGLARRGQWVPIRDVFPGAIGCEDLLSTEVLIQPMVPARDSRPLILGQKIKVAVRKEGHEEARGEDAERQSGAGGQEESRAGNKEGNPDAAGAVITEDSVRLDPDALQLVDGEWRTKIVVGGKEVEVPLASTGYMIRTDAPPLNCALVDLRFGLKARRGMARCELLTVVSIKKPTGGKGTAGKDVRVLCENTSVVFQETVKDGNMGILRVYITTGAVDHRALAWATSQDDLLVVAGSGCEAFFPVLGVCPALRDRLQ